MRSSMISTLRRMPLLKTAIAGALLFAVAFLLGHTALESQALRTLSGTALILTCILIGLVAHRQSTELRNLAQTDHLTGLTNHRGFHELLPRRSWSERSGTSSSCRWSASTSTTSRLSTTPMAIPMGTAC